MSIFVEDLQAAKTFYTEVFGVKVVFEDEVSAAVKFDNLLINLLHQAKAPALVEPLTVGNRDSGARFQLSIWVDDVDTVCTELEQRGAKITNGPTNQPWGMRTATFIDPDGNSWEVAQGT
jgi:catechol 2,3-dioxygenase-like lactoylglutathione lyase family enzyme